MKIYVQFKTIDSLLCNRRFCRKKPVFLSIIFFLLFTFACVQVTDPPVLPKDTDDPPVTPPPTTTPLPPNPVGDIIANKIDLTLVSEDFFTLSDIWSDGETLWILSVRQKKISAFSLATAEEIPSRTINIDGSEAESPASIWSDGSTIWVADLSGRILAYDLASAERRSEKDIHTDEIGRNIYPRSIWSDGKIMYILDQNSRLIHRYDLLGEGFTSFDSFTGLRDSQIAIPTGLWSDGETLYVVDRDSPTIIAVNIQDGSYAEAKNISIPQGSGFQGLYSNGRVFWTGISSFESESIIQHSLPQGSSAPSSPPSLAPQAQYSFELGRRVAVSIPNSGATVEHCASTAGSLPKGLAIIANVGTCQILGLPSEVGAAELQFQARSQTGSNTYSIRVSIVQSPPQLESGILRNEETYRYNQSNPNSPSLHLHAGNYLGLKFPVTGGYPESCEMESSTMLPHLEFKLENGLCVLTGTILEAHANTITVTLRTANAQGSSSLSLSISVEKVFGKPYSWETISVDPSTALFSDGQRLWYADYKLPDIYAYDITDSSPLVNGLSYNADLSFELEDWSTSIWSDGTWLWSMGDYTGNIEVYNLKTRTRDRSKEFFRTTHFTNMFNPRSIWSNGETLWVLATHFDGFKIYAFDLETKEAKPELDIPLHGSYPSGIWSDGKTMWVGNRRSYTSDPSYRSKIYAYDLFAKTRRPELDIDFTDLPYGSSSLFDIFSNGEYLWGAHPYRASFYAYNLAPNIQPPSLTAPSNANIEGGGRVAVSIPNNGGIPSRCSLSSGSLPPGLEVVANAGTCQVLGVVPSTGTGTHSISILARNSAGTSSLNIVLNIVPPSFGSRVNSDSIDFKTSYSDLGHFVSQDLISNENTIWTIHSTRNLSIPAFAGSDLSRKSSEDIRMPNYFSPNYQPVSMWSDGTTAWVSDRAKNTLYAFNMSTGGWDNTKTIEFYEDDEEDFLPYIGGIWSNGSTMWVVVEDWQEARRDGIYAFDLATGRRRPEEDFNRLDNSNYQAYDIWSDGKTMWVTDKSTTKVFAYDVETKRALREKYIITNVTSQKVALWSDHKTIWVSSNFTSFDAFALNYAPKAPNLSLPEPQIHQLSGRLAVSFENAGDPPTACKLVSGTLPAGLALLSNAGTCQILGVPSETATENITIEARNDAGSSSIHYTLKINPVAMHNPQLDLISLDPNNGLPTGIWSDGTTIWVADETRLNAKIYAYKLADGSRDSSKDINTLEAAGNTSPQEIWSDGRTMWVVDLAGGRIFAYTLSTGIRNTELEYNTHGTFVFDETGTEVQVDEPTGLWSNGEYIWYAQFSGGVIHAHSTEDKYLQQDKHILCIEDEIEIFALKSIWSDGSTMWAATLLGDVYAFSFERTPASSSNPMGCNKRLPEKDWVATIDGSQDVFPQGLWSDGSSTFWVTNSLDATIRAFTVPVDLFE